MGFNGLKIDLKLPLKGQFQKVKMVTRAIITLLLQTQIDSSFKFKILIDTLKNGLQELNLFIHGDPSQYFV